MRAAPGERLGERYELVAPIASGGMAQVWKAVDLVLDRDVAAKILHPHLATDEAFVARFRREAVAAARLSHRSIVSVYDTISTPSVEAIVMELISGRTLRAVLDDAGALPVAEVVRLGADIAAALDVAHRAGIVHRDIKPANIMIADDRRVLVTDFGIAKAGTDADLTTTGTLLGTAKYLSPEQVTGAPIDPRSDLYALGVVLFEALTGSVPFKANTDAATALARLHQDPPPLRQLRPNVPADLDAVISRLMARDLNRRFPRADVARDALLAVDTSPSANPVPTALSPAGGQRRQPPGPTALSPAGGPGPTPGPTALSPAGGPRHQPPSAGGPPGRGPDPGIGNGRPGGNRPHPAAVTGDAPAGRAPVGVAGPPQNVPNSPPGRTRPPEPPPGLVQGPPLQAQGAQLGAGGLGSLQPVSISSETVRRSGRSRLAALVTATLLGLGVIIAIALLTGIGPGGSTEVNPLDETSSGLPIASATSFDPQTTDADKSEREDLVDLAFDGDLDTAWMTEPYRGRNLSGLKTGVGLLLTLEERLPLNEITLETNTSDWTAEIYVGDGFDDDESTWGPPAAAVEAGSRRMVLNLGRAEGQIVLIWIRDTGVSGDRNRFELAEVVIR
jgi:serine/threonine-protein kinase